MFDEFDFNHDGKLDAAESAFMHDTLFGDSDNDSLDYDYDDDDDDYYYHTYGGGSSGSTYRSSTSSTYKSPTTTSYSYTPRKYGLTVGQSILYGLIAYVVVFGLLGITFDGSAEYVPLFLWGGISALLYFGTNNR